jgi:hypothetical protein
MNGFAKLMNAGLRGDFSERSSIFASKGTALYKDSEQQEIRPLTIGSIMSRIIGKFIMVKLKAKMKLFFEPLQLGIGTPNGTEVIVYAANYLLETKCDDESLALLAIDFKNAFNNINRQMMMDECKQHIHPK